MATVALFALAAVLVPILLTDDDAPSGDGRAEPEPVTAAGQTIGRSPSLTRYPYLTDLVNATASTGYATVNWATDRSAPRAEVRWGEADGKSCTANVTEATRAPIVVQDTPQYQWRATLAVKPDTKFCYRVYLKTQPEIDLLGGDASPTFVSQLSAPEPFSFAVFGDWGKAGPDGSNTHQANVLRQIAASGARFVMSTGDTGYPDGTQDSHGDLHHKGHDVSAVFGPDFWPVVGASMPLFPAVGNHDPNEAFILNWPQEKAAALSGGRYRMENYCCLNGTASKDYATAWYAFDAGEARFYVLDAAWAEGNPGTGDDPYKNDYAYHWTPSSEEYRWLENDLASHPSKLKFAFFHYPLYSDQSSERSNPHLRGPQSLEGLLNRHTVNMAFNGHAHIYQRNYKPGPDSLITYVTGAGGARLQSVGGEGCSPNNAYAVGFLPANNSGNACGSAPVPESDERVYHFLLVKVEGSKVTVTPTDELGRTFDVVTYDFGSNGAGAPSPPALKVSAGAGNEMQLSWSPSTDDLGVNGYRIFRDGSLVATVAGHVTTHRDHGLQPDRPYVYEVEAFDGNGLVSRSTQARATSGKRNAVFTFHPTDDATIDSGHPNTNYGASTTGRVDGDRLQHFLLKFSVSGLNGCQVGKATLRLSPTGGSPGASEVRRADPNWTEAALTWANAPAAGEAVVAPLAASPDGLYEAIITPVVAGDGVVSLRVTPRSTNGTVFSSKEQNRGGGHGPELVVECLAR